MKNCVLLCLLFLFGLINAQDPAGSWLSYAVYAANPNDWVTRVNATWVVPSLPEVNYGSNAPGWWYGVQTAQGNGALVQPILAWGYLGAEYTIFNGVFDWNDESWHTSPEKYTVQPGDTITSWVQYHQASNSYVMFIKSQQTGKYITTTYTLEAAQGSTPESTVYFVLEHQPYTCRAYPKNGECTFSNIGVEVNNKAVKPTWQAKQMDPACSSQAQIVNPSTIKFTWSADDETPKPQVASASGLKLPNKSPRVERSL